MNNYWNHTLVNNGRYVSCIGIWESALTLILQTFPTGSRLFFRHKTTKFQETSLRTATARIYAQESSRTVRRRGQFESTDDLTVRVELSVRYMRARSKEIRVQQLGLVTSGSGSDINNAESCKNLYEKL
jgi:hypothetical protein